MTKKTIIVVNGKLRSGKDTFAENIKNICQNINPDLSFSNISTVDHIKKIATEQFGWDGIKDSKGRRLLSDLKDASTRYNSGPFQYIVNSIEESFYKHSLVKQNLHFIFVVHSREPDEILKFVDHFNYECVTVLVKRNNNVKISCHADANVEDCQYDYILENNGSLEKFYKTCERFVQDLNIV